MKENGPLSTADDPAAPPSQNSAEIIENRGRKHINDPFFLSIMKQEDIDRYPSVLDFASSRRSSARRRTRGR
jgi:hypothetical protein